MKILVSGTDPLSDKVARFLRGEGHTIIRLEGPPTEDMDPLNIAGVWAGSTVIETLSTVNDDIVKGMERK